ncbi:hypothetical protein [Actinomadura violacea]|uniref:Uncharacterized protein n=1 Tax=Actinomadura violacea TaxID=2819934 RepID=A0ABS3RXC4_9ACTN|nr:hypothetical protein [Actinomadura violacea]MBO2461400.1 hypothetical protein [Actinomadura violacea]
MNRMHAARTPAPCPKPRPRPHRKPASAALTTLLATAAALVATTHAAPADATVPPPAATPPPPEPAAAAPLPGGAPALSPTADGGVAPVTMPAAEVAADPGNGGTQAAPPPRGPSAPAVSGPPSPLPGTLAGLAPSAAAAGVGGLLPPPAPNPAVPPNTAVPQTDPAPGTDGEPAPPAAETDPPADDPPADDPAGAVSGVLTAAVPDMPKSVRLTQQVAEGFLRANGVRWRSTGGCSDRARRTCTSFDGLRWGTLKGLLDFQAASGCPVTITGGTETGHAGGPRSHGSGHKLDIATGRCVDTAIRRYPYRGVRGDGARLYRSPDGALFARERDHWDITFP